MLDPDSIKSVAIHPAIGIARVGNAPDEGDYFLGPEVPGTAPEAAGGFRDGQGRLKRQAARFRVYATLKSGDVVEIIAGDGTGIAWRVTVANLKAGWYRFTTAMDLPRHLAVSTSRRNPDIGPADVDSGFLIRTHLDIRPSAKTISGRNQGGAGFAFDDGTFMNKPVYLGELRTDGDGRLLVLGGRGEAGCDPPDRTAPTFANNDGWHDDVSDGPVRASVTIGGRSFEADPAYVVVTPPNYGPGLFGAITMDDVAREAFVAAGFEQPPPRPSFTADIWPIFDRLTGNQWVNHGIFLLHGKGSPLDARNPAVIARLADASAEGQPFRQAVFALFRDPAALMASTATLPPFYGDGVDYGFDDAVPLDTSADLVMTPILQRILAQWAEGEFEADWKGIADTPTFDTLSPADQCAALDRANLYDLLGGPFHPGIELTWIMRQPSLWRAPYRLNLAPEGVRARQDYGPELTPEICLGPDGPLSETGPGALTRWLGVPWQTDCGSCSAGSEYTPSYYLSTPSFWGARVPNDVMPAGAYARLAGEELSDLQRDKHFGARKSWYRLIKRDAVKTRAQGMIDQWWRLGVVEAKPAPGKQAGEGDFHVEEVTAEDGHDPTLTLIARVEELAKPGLPKTASLPLRQVAARDTQRRPRPRIHYGRGDI